MAFTSTVTREAQPLSIRGRLFSRNQRSLFPRLHQTWPHSSMVGHASRKNNGQSRPSCNNLSTSFATPDLSAGHGVPDDWLSLLRSFQNIMDVVLPQYRMARNLQPSKDRLFQLVFESGCHQLPQLQRPCNADAYTRSSSSEVRQLVDLKMRNS